MTFDIATAKPVGADRSIPDSAEGGFDLSSAKPVEESATKRLGNRLLVGPVEAALTIGSSLTGGLVGRLGGALGGLAADVTTGKYGTQEGAQMAAQTAEEGAKRFTYEPRTQEGRDALESIGRFFDKTKLAGIGPAESVALGNAAPALRPTAAALEQDAKNVGARVWRGDPNRPQPAPEPQMAGFGSAMTEQETLRRQRAADLPVPIPLTKGQATRDFAQQQFERETAKNAVTGGPLRERFAEQNQKVLQNFDSWIDDTGAQSGSLRATGETVTQALVDKANNAKSQINAAYAKARAAGAMEEKVDVAPLRKYLDDHKAEAINAPVLTSTEAKLQGILDKSGSATINDLEEVRKMVGILSGKDATNAHFGKEVKGVIDQMTEGRGGDLYEMARRLRYRYGQQFEDHAIIDKLLSNKPGTKDRAVAYEDVFDHSVLKGSLDDVRVVRQTLQTAGPKGEQAWRELQGATLQHIRDEITKNVQTDQLGNRVLSPARLDRLVQGLDKDGKLDFIFGKQGAQQIRDVNGIAQDAFTAPPGAVNSSNTASILLKVLDKVATKTSGVPFLGSVLNYGAGEVKNARVRGLVSDALKEGQP